MALALSPALGGDPEDVIKIASREDIHVTIPKSHTDVENRAAQLLVNMLGKALSVESEVAAEGEFPNETGPIISVGRTMLAGEKGLLSALEKASGESIGIAAWPSERLICLAGSGDLGTYHAVARFLEKYAGIKWYFPDELGLCVPNKKVLEIPSGIEIQNPDFPIRWVGKGFAKEWALFNGMNTNLDENVGLQVYKSGHTFHDFLSPGEYFHSHPEYFSEVKGKRIPKQLCTSSPEVIELVSQSIIRLFDERPEIDMITLFPEDGRGFCECSQCRALDPQDAIPISDINTPTKRRKELGPEWRRALSRRMTIFYLSVAAKVLSVKPDKKIQVGAYSAYLLSPKDFNEKAPENVYLLMCHGACHNHPLDSSTCEINSQFREAMAGWKKIYHGITIYEYYRKAAMLELPFPILHSIRRDIPFLKKEGVYGLYTQFSSDYYRNGLNYYIAARLLWNSNENVDLLLEDFYRSFYGTAWEQMKTYWENYEKAAIRADIHLACQINQMDMIFSKELLSEQARILENAISIADSSLARKRIERTRISLEYAKLCMDYIEDAKAVAAALKGKGRTSTSSMRDLKEKAGLVRTFWEKYRGSDSFGAGQTNNLKRFFNRPEWVVGQMLTTEEEEEEKESKVNEIIFPDT